MPAEYAHASRRVPGARPDCGADRCADRIRGVPADHSTRADSSRQWTGSGAGFRGLVPQRRRHVHPLVRLFQPELSRGAGYPGRAEQQVRSDAGRSGAADALSAPAADWHFHGGRAQGLRHAEAHVDHRRSRADELGSRASSCRVGNRCVEGIDEREHAARDQVRGERQAGPGARRYDDDIAPRPRDNRRR